MAESTSLTSATRAELKARSATATALGRHALLLANLLENAESAAMVSAASKELRNVMTEIRKVHPLQSGSRSGARAGNVTPPSRLAELRAEHESRGA